MVRGNSFWSVLGVDEIPNAYTYSWLTLLSLQLIALLGTWKFVPMVFTDFTLGLMMFAGGLVILNESLLDESYGDWKRSIRSWDLEDRRGDATGVIGGVFALLYSHGLITGTEFMIKHFGGVQGGVILALLFFTFWQGWSNRKKCNSGYSYR